MFRCFAKTAQALLCGFLVTLASNVVHAGSEFEKCCEYARAIAELNTAWDKHQQVAEQLRDRCTAAMQRIDETESEFARLRQERQVESYKYIETMIFRSNLLSQMAREAGQAPNANANTRSERFRRGEQQMGVAAATMTTDMLQQHMRELDSAGSVVLERRFNALREIVTSMQEYEKWTVHAKALMGRYWELSDVVGVRSELEHQAALRELGNADENNPAVHLARAAILTHLEQYDEAGAELEQLADQPEWANLVLVFKARIEMKSGKRDLALQTLRQLPNQAKNDPQVRLVRAQIFSMAGDVDNAKDQWSQLVKSKQDEVAARRALAWLMASSSNLNNKEKQEALKHAKVADGLSGGDQWSCQLALALALAASGEKDQAIEACKKAQGLAIGTQKELCESCAEKIAAGQKLVWKFE